MGCASFGGIAEFGIDPAAVDGRRILDLARDVSHQVGRPAAPAPAFSPGLAIGAGIPADDAMGRVLMLAENWEAEAAGSAS